MVRAVVFISGRGSNLEALIKACESGPLAGICKIAGVVSNRKGAGGIEKAKAAGLPTLVLPLSPGQTRENYDSRILQEIAPWSPQLIILAGFDRILSPVMIKAFPSRIINIHPADPAQFKGLHGYQWAFSQKLPRTYITVHLVDEGVDTGPVLDQAEVDLTGIQSLADVEARGLAVEHQLYPLALAKFITNSQLFKES